MIAIVQVITSKLIFLIQVYVEKMWRKQFFNNFSYWIFIRLMNKADSL